MATSLADIAATLLASFPVRGEQVSLELVMDPDTKTASPEGRVTFRLVIWDKQDNGDLSIRDIKEQDLYLYDPALLVGDVPVLAYLKGWALALGEVFQRGSTSMFETLMPHDLADVKALKLRKAKTPEDYRDAFLAKSRLGKYLATAPS